jgi:hypothetical protein
VDVVVDVAVREVAVGEAQQQIELSSRRRKAKTKEKKYDLFWKPLLFILCNNMYVNYYLVCLLFVVFSRFSVRCNFFFCRAVAGAGQRMLSFLFVLLTSLFVVSSTVLLLSMCG